MSERDQSVAALGYECRPGAARMRIEAGADGVAVRVLPAPGGDRGVAAWPATVGAILLIAVVLGMAAQWLSRGGPPAVGRGSVFSWGLPVLFVSAVLFLLAALAAFGPRAGPVTMLATPRGLDYIRDPFGPHRWPRGQIVGVYAGGEARGEQHPLMLRLIDGRLVTLGHGTLDDVQAMAGALRQGLGLPPP